MIDFDGIEDWMREEARRLFAGPRDIVGGHPPDRETILRWNENAERYHPSTSPGELVEDVDGRPLGVDPSRSGFDSHVTIIITARDLERVGLDPDDVPYLGIIDEHHHLIRPPAERN